MFDEKTDFVISLIFNIFNVQQKATNLLQLISDKIKNTDICTFEEQDYYTKYNVLNISCELRRVFKCKHKDKETITIKDLVCHITLIISNSYFS